MGIANESNVDLSFNTDAMRAYATQYKDIANEMREMAAKLNALLNQLKDSGWTTNAGKAFQKMVEYNWETNMDKYADLLLTLGKILNESANKYDNLVNDYIETLKI